METETDETDNVMTSTTAIAIGTNNAEQPLSSDNGLLDDRLSSLAVSSPLSPPSPPPSCLKRCLKECRTWDLGGVFFMLAGALLIVINAPNTINEKTGKPIVYNVTQAQSLLLQPTTFFWVLLLGLGTLLLCSTIALCPRPTLPCLPGVQQGVRFGRITRAVAHGLIGGAMGGYTFLPTKIALSLQTKDIGSSFWWGMGVWGVISEMILLINLNVGMITLPKSSVVIVSFYYISSTVVSSFLGLLTFGLLPKLYRSGLGLVGFSSGMLLCLVGVFIVSYREPTERSEEREEHVLLNQGLLQNQQGMNVQYMGKK